MHSTSMAAEQTKERRENYHHGDLKGALLRATRQLIEDKGRDQFSVTDACRVAGVSTAAPYKHFKNKEEMVQGAVLDAMHRHYTGLQEDLRAHEKGTKGRIVAMGLNYIGFALREPEMFKLRFSPNETEDPPALKESGNTIYSLVKEEVRAALGEPEVNAKVEERSYMLWCFVHGLSYISLMPDLQDKRPAASVEKLLEDLADRVLVD
ncbi:MAG: TetR/AcrR family transcriptional regulator [Pseudomonadota bacterium]